jgi:dTDP-4-amino-4,6-dideoxygalactose transaminase
VHDSIGYNYRLANINAALGCAQLEQLPTLIEAKRNLYKKYKAAFNKVPQLHVVNEPEGCNSNFWLQTLYLNESVSNQRDEILEATNKANLMTRPAWTLLNKLSPYRQSPRMNLTVAESLERSLINLPSSAQLGIKACL